MKKISKVQTTKFYRKLVVGFSAATVLLLAIVIYYSLSKTTITIGLKPQEQSATFSVMIICADCETTSSGPVLRGTLLATEVSGSETAINTNEGSQVEAQATGTVTIYNNWSQVQPLAATTRLLTPDGILFRIRNRVDVPAGGTSENVEVYADVPGASGNIEPTTFTIPGLWAGLQDTIYAESSAPMTGGLRNAAVLTNELIGETRQALRERLIADAAAEFSSTEEAQARNQTVSTSAVTALVISEETSADAGTEVDSFTMDMSIRAVGVLFDENELMSIALDKLSDECGEDERILQHSTEDLEYSIEQYDLDTGVAHIKGTLKAGVVPRLSNGIFDRENVTGKDLHEVEAYFSNFDSVDSVNVEFSPFWVSTVPQLKDHIEIKLSE
ncbi:MAG: hypothetical protein WC505_01665 [Patescibacteria group bacterium]